MFSQEWPHVRDSIHKIREAFPLAKIIVGGEHPTAMPEYTLRDCPHIDYLVAGEGELAMLELVWRIRTGQDVSSIFGIHYLKEGKYFYQDRIARRLSSITEMPWPAWHLINVEPYFRPNFTMGIGRGRNMAMLATRGCPYECTFCSSAKMWTIRYKMRDVKDVVDEIEYYIKTYSVNSIDLYDLTAICETRLDS